MKTFRLLSCLAATAILFSCNEKNNPVDPDPDCSLENYAMLQTGNYWIYRRHEIDSNYKGRSEINAVDSVVVEGTRLYAGKQAYVLVAHGSDGKKDTLLLMTQGSGLFAPTYQVSGYAVFGGDCHCLKPRWERIADCGRQRWTSLDKAYFNEDQYPSMGPNGEMFNTTTSIQSDIQGEKQNEGPDASGRNAKYYSVSSNWRYDSRCSRDFSEKPSSSIHSPYRHSITLGEGVGILEWRTNSNCYYSNDTTAPCNGQFIPNMSITGAKVRERRIIRYSVKK